MQGVNPFLMSASIAVLRACALILKELSQGINLIGTDPKIPAFSTELLDWSTETMTIQ